MARARSPWAYFRRIARGVGAIAKRGGRKEREGGILCATTHRGE